MAEDALRFEGGRELLVDGSSCTWTTEGVLHLEGGCELLADGSYCA